MRDEFFVAVRKIPTGLALFCICLAVVVSGVQAQEKAARASLPKLQTNQAYVENVLRDDVLAIDDVKAVFAHTFAQLPDRVRVYPTENYFYFSFYHGGVRYAGNFRLDTADRDQGIVYFAYFEAFTGWRRDEIDKFKSFAAEDGVKVEKVENLTYRITVNNKSVMFELNDLSHVKPPENSLHSDEVFIGPVFDESGIQFFLIYNPRLKLFHYILNEIAPVPDQNYTSKISKSIIVGRRTGFVYYRDKYLPRKILIGVYKPNADVNNYLDGPFDQLPDNFIQGDQLKKAILEISPDLAGKIDRYGIMPGGDDRFLIAPYLYYTYIENLEIFEECASNPATTRLDYYDCFVTVEKTTDENAAIAPQGEKQ